MTRREEIEKRRRLHRTIARLLGRQLLQAEVEVVGLRHLARSGPYTRAEDALPEKLARCKSLRRELATELNMLATLGLAIWAREQKLALVRKVLAVRAAAWVAVARAQAEVEAEDALAGRIEVDVLTN